MRCLSAASGSEFVGPRQTCQRGAAVGLNILYRDEILSGSGRGAENHGQLAVTTAQLDIPEMPRICDVAIFRTGPVKQGGVRRSDRREYTNSPPGYKQS